MYVLMFEGNPLACSELFERLNERMAKYPASQQELMTIVSDIPVLT